MDLMKSLFRLSQDGTRPVNFKTGSEEFKIHLGLNIDSLTREDGSGRSWIITGSDPDGIRYEGYYSSRRRKGHLDVIS